MDFLQTTVLILLFHILSINAAEEENRTQRSTSNPRIFVHRSSSKLTTLPLGETTRSSSSPRQRIPSKRESPSQTPRSESPLRGTTKSYLKPENEEIRNISPRRSTRNEELTSPKEASTLIESAVSGIINLFSVAEDENQPVLETIDIGVSEICRLIHREYHKMSDIPEETLNPAFHMFRYYFFHHIQNVKHDFVEVDTIKSLTEVVSGYLETWINDLLVKKYVVPTFETILNQFWRMTIWPDFVGYMSAMDNNPLNLIVESMKYIGANHKDSVMQIIFFKKIDKIHARLPHKIPNTQYWLIAAQSFYDAQNYWECYKLMKLTNDKSKYSWIEAHNDNVQKHVLRIQTEKWNLCYSVVDLFECAFKRTDVEMLPSAKVTQPQQEMLHRWYRSMVTQTDEWLLDKKVKLNLFIPGSSGSRPNIVQLSMPEVVEWLDNLLKLENRCSERNT